MIYYISWVVLIIFIMYYLEPNIKLFIKHVIIFIYCDVIGM